MCCRANVVRRQRARQKRLLSQRTNVVTVATVAVIAVPLEVHAATARKANAARALIAHRVSEVHAAIVRKANAARARREIGHRARRASERHARKETGQHVRRASVLPAHRVNVLLDRHAPRSLSR